MTQDNLHSLPGKHFAREVEAVNLPKLINSTPFQPPTIIQRRNLSGSWTILPLLVVFVWASLSSFFEVFFFPLLFLWLSKRVNLLWAESAWTFSILWFSFVSLSVSSILEFLKTAYVGTGQIPQSIFEKKKKTSLTRTALSKNNMTDIKKTLNEGIRSDQFSLSMTFHSTKFWRD